MRNITVFVPDEVYRRARIRAAELGRSVSALVAGFLSSLSDEHDEFRRSEELEERVLAETTAFSAGERLSRDEVHDRSLR